MLKYILINISNIDLYTTLFVLCRHHGAVLDFFKFSELKKHPNLN